MPETLLSETLGEDTTTQLYRDAAGAYRVRVMALPLAPAESGGERPPVGAAARIYQDQPLDAWEARALYGAPAAKRYVPAEDAFAGDA